MTQTVVVHSASNFDPNPGPPGEKPYEMAGRQEERTPLVSFDEVGGWEVEGRNAEGWLYRSDERKLYREHCGKLVYWGRGDNPALLVRPREPIVIPDPWDSINFWNWGNNWGWAPDPDTPPLQVAVVLRDAAGWEFEIPLGQMDYTYWFLMNGRLHAEHLQRLQRPVALVGFRFTNAHNREPRTVYLGPCTFFQEELKPLDFEPWPETLPFPNRPETILPTNKTKDFENRTHREGATTVFSYLGPDAVLEYRYRPSDGTLGDIELLYQGRTIRPCAGGGLQLAGKQGVAAPPDPAVRRTLKSQELVGDTLTVAWRLEWGEVTAEVEYRLRLRQKSLIVEMDVDQPVVERVALGRATGISNGKLFWVPYLTYGGNDPRILYADGLFFFTQFDWYVSDASILYGGASLGPDGAVYNGGAQYIPKTDGVRNPVRERLFINVSPDVQEVFPTIPNPPSPMKQEQGDRLWRVKGGADHQAEIEEAARLRRYGCEKVTIRYHEDSWRDAGESFTFRLQAAPGRGGDAALRRFVQAVQALGWRVGLYTNYTDYAPVNSYWNEDWVARRPNGDWQRAWMRCYAPKPMIAVEMEAKLAPQIHARFGENHSYCDVHTAVSPFSRVDYDARVPGAGTFRRTFECYGRLLYNEKFAHHGPVYSEGNNHWWYAGLTDGNYAQLISGSPPREPLFVDFDLLKMHPLQMDAGMGAPSMFFRGAPPNLDQFIATTLAYGHLGFLDWDTLPGLLKIYYMLQPLEKHYIMVPVRRIAYEREGKLIDTSQALISDAYRNNRVYLIYESGAEVYVNGSPEPWVVTGPDRRYELPPWGYVAWQPDQVLTYSAIAPLAGPEHPQGPRGRVDYCLSGEQSYADSRGGFAFLGPLALQGSAALKCEQDAWWVIPTTECADFAFAPGLIGADAGRDIAAFGYAEDGGLTGSPEVRWSRGLCHLLPPTRPAFKYKVRAAAGPCPPAVRCSSTLAPRGKTLEAELPAGVALQTAEVFWERGGRCTPAQATLTGQRLTCRVPTDAQPGEHLWLGMPAGEGTLWLDFIAGEPQSPETLNMTR